jgi:hypothetical protein
MRTISPPQQAVGQGPADAPNRGPSLDGSVTSSEATSPRWVRRGSASPERA